MLVLNTNKNEQVDWISNYNLRSGAYPDASQALIHFMGSTWGTIFMYPGNETQVNTMRCYCEWVHNEVTPTLKTIQAICMNGTPINYVEHPIRPSNNLYGWYASAWVWCYNRICFNSYPSSAWFTGDRTGCTNVWEIHKCMRFGTVGTLDAWVTVWKTFRVQPYNWQHSGTYVNVWVATFNCLETWVRMKWWVMHRDWTITYAWSVCRCYCGKPTGTWTYDIIWWSCTDSWKNPIFYGESEWVVSQEWDRPIVDLDHYLCWDMNYVATWIAAQMIRQNWTTNCSCWYMDFWRRWQWSNDNDEYSRPFQISLDV